MAIAITKACVDAAVQLGLPEARLPLAEAAVLLATAPKSNTAHNAIIAAMDDLRRGKTGDIPGTCKTSTPTPPALITGSTICIPTISPPLGGTAVSARCAQGRPLLSVGGQQDRAGRQGLLGADQGQASVKSVRIGGRRHPGGE